MAENLWALREQKKLSVAALANRAGLPIGVIVEYESGQRSVDPRHLSRLARALYVEEAEIRLRSDPRPEVRREEPRPPMRDAGVQAPAARPQRPKDKGARPKPPPKPPAPIKPTQITHIEGLLQRLGRSVADLEAEVGRPLAQLDRPAASQLIKLLQAQAAQANQANRHRAYLPESVDQFEAQYLNSAQQAGTVLHFTLFEGEPVEGKVVGYGPYSITLHMADGSEMTLNKLALISYHALQPVMQQQSQEARHEPG